MEEIKKIIKETIEYSDIVWPKYGEDTIEKLTQRIIDKITIIKTLNPNVPKRRNN